MTDNPAAPLEEELEPSDPDADAMYDEAQNREEDPEGDPAAEDPGDTTEPPSDTDPPEEQQINPDAGDDFSDLEEGEDTGDMDDGN